MLHRARCTTTIGTIVTLFTQAKASYLTVTPQLGLPALGRP